MDDHSKIGADAPATPAPGDNDPPVDGLLPFWRASLGVSDWLGEDVFAGLYAQFVERVAIPSDTVAAIRSRPVIYVANHQVALESLVFVFALAALSGVHIRTLVKEAHRTSWIGELLGLLFDYPGQTPPPPSYFRDEYDPQSLVDLLKEMRKSLTEDGHSLLIHGEGARVLSCRRPVSRLSAVFIDLARDTGATIVPVRFAGGLPIEPMDDYREFPIGFGRQTYFLGPPIEPETINTHHPRERRPLIVDAINGAGGGLAGAEPAAADSAFLTDVQNFLHETATTQVKAVIIAALRRLADPSEQTRRALAAVAGEKLALAPAPEDEWLGRFCFWLTDGRARTVTDGSQGLQGPFRPPE